MSNRWFRFVIALLALAASGAAGFRIFQREQVLAADVAALKAGDVAAESAVTTTAEIKAALHAYVAPGQGQSFWTSRSAALIDKLRSSVLELDRVAASVGVQPTEALDLSDRLAASEQRARDYMRAGQQLLAGDVIFTEARDLLDATRTQVARAREQVAQAGDARQSAIRREQAMLGLGAAAILSLAVLILVPPGQAEQAAPVQTAATDTPKPAGAEAHDEYARVIPNPKPSREISRPATATARGTAKTGSTEKHAERPALQAEAPVDATPVAQAVPTPLAAPTVALNEAAAVCSDLARVSDTTQITQLLARASGVLNAAGIIVWMATDDGDELFPAAGAGYDERLFARIGSIRGDASNLTAAAFRSATTRTSPRHEHSLAAIAVPLVTPQGPVGVFSAEMRDVSEVDPQRLAVATIFAAQLSMLLGSMPTSDTTATAQQVM